MGTINRATLVGEVTAVTEEFKYQGKDYVCAVIKSHTGKLVNARGKKEALQVDHTLHKFFGEVRNRKESDGSYVEFLWVYNVAPIDMVENEVFVSGRLFAKKELSQTKKGVPVINFKIIVQKEDNDKIFNILSCEAYEENAEIISKLDKLAPISISGRMSSIERNENVYNNIYVKAIAVF